MNLSPKENFDGFCRTVFEDLALQERLRDETDRKRFVALLVQLAKEQGYDFDVETVEEALRASKLAWFQKWV